MQALCQTQETDDDTTAVRGHSSSDPDEIGPQFTGECHSQTLFTHRHATTCCMATQKAGPRVTR